MAVIFGTELNDTLNGRDENDSIFGRAGNDTLSGGLGDDFLVGEEGDDTINGSNGNDRLFGGDGNDRLYGGDDNDSLIGGADNDSLIGGADNDNLIGGAGNDNLYGEASNDNLFGEAGNDNLFGSFGNDTLNGGAGNDRLDGAGMIAGLPSSRGRGEFDVLTGGPGTDTFILRGIESFSVSGGPEYLGGGNSDYALITDFNQGEDVIELATNEFTKLGPQNTVSTKVEYSLGASPHGLPSGTGIYVNNLGNQPDLIAVLQGVDLNTVSLTEDYFQFV